MPLVALAVVAYAAGLLLGAGRLLAPAVLLAIAGAGWAVCARDGRAVAIGLLLCAGTTMAWSATRRAEVCALRLAQLSTWMATLEEDGAPGGTVRATVAAAGCVARGTIAVERGRGSGGDVVRLTGLLVPAERNVFVRRATLGPVVGHDAVVRLRDRARRSIDRVFERDAPLARALLIADTRSLAPELRERYAAAGLVHMLSISGLHVAIIAGALQLLFVASRLPRRTALLAAAGATALYVVVIGAPAPAVRSGAMLGVLALSALLQRPTSPWASLAVGALLPLVLDPLAVLDLGYQLSVAGIAGLIASGALARRALAPRLTGGRLRLARELLTSAVATLVTAPLVAWSFGRVSLVAPLTNLIAAPVVALAQPMLFLALLCAPALSAARFVAGAVHPLLASLDAIARAGAAVPYASVSVSPTLVAAALCGVGSAAFVAACVARHPGRPLVICAGAVAALVWCPVLPAPPSAGVELHMLDVGQGDALAVRTPRGRWIVVDAGRVWRGGDAGRAIVVPYVRARGGEVAAFILSHPHADHVGGAASVLRALRPRQYWDAAYAAGSVPYRESLDAAVGLGVEWRRARPGDTLAVDGVRVRFLAPDSLWTASLADPNDASTVVQITYGAVRFLLVGDAELGEEQWLLRHAAGDLRADVLKVGHHGSRTSSSAPFLDAVRPRVALVSVGLGNSYGHPSAVVLDALAATGADVLRTDVLGAVVVRTDGRTLTLDANGVQWPLSPAASSEASPARVPAPGSASPRR